MNCRWVAGSAASGILLTSPIVRTASALRPPSNFSVSRGSMGARPGLTMSRCLSNSRVMPGLADLFRGLEPLMPGACDRERLVKIFYDVGAVLDADREPDGLRQHAG